MNDNGFLIAVAIGIQTNKEINTTGLINSPINSHFRGFKGGVIDTFEWRFTAPPHCTYSFSSTLRS
jgi:hypothetical protein